MRWLVGRATVPSWKTKYKAARARSGHSHPLMMGFCRPWESTGKWDPLDLIKHSHSLHRGLPRVTRVLVARNRHQVQWDLLEGNLMLTPPLVRFIGGKSGAHWINRRPRDQTWKRAGTSPDRGPWSNLTKMLDTIAAMAFCPKRILMSPQLCLLTLKTKPQFGASALTAQVTNYLCPGHQEMEHRIMSPLGFRRRKQGPACQHHKGLHAPPPPRQKRTFVLYCQALTTSHYPPFPVSQICEAIRAVQQSDDGIFTSTVSALLEPQTGRGN